MRQLLLILAVLLGAATAALIYHRSGDGPGDIIPGGRLVSGPLITTPITDWSFLEDGQYIELQLEDPPTSRITGSMVHDGALYVPCDLGFMWGRFSGPNRWLLNLIYLFKSWHEHALADGRVVLRIDGKRYPRQAVRVTDPERIAALKEHLEALATQWLGEPLGPPPSSGPNDIWFFRMDPRPTEPGPSSG